MRHRLFSRWLQGVGVLSRLGIFLRCLSALVNVPAPEYYQCRLEISSVIAVKDSPPIRSLPGPINSAIVVATLP